MLWPEGNEVEFHLDEGSGYDDYPEQKGHTLSWVEHAINKLKLAPNLVATNVLRRKVLFLGQVARYYVRAQHDNLMRDWKAC